MPTNGNLNNEKNIPAFFPKNVGELMTLLTPHLCMTIKYIFVSNDRSEYTLELTANPEIHCT